MAERFAFSLEDKAKRRAECNWREPQPGDVCWHCPDPDEHGTIDPDQLVLCLLSNQATANSEHFRVSILNKPQPLVLVDRKDLCLAFTRAEAKTFKGHVNG